MANRYWVGGSGTWNTTSTTNWSTGSGGSGGASVPTVADNVFFDQAGTYTVSMTGALACLDITVSAGTVTFAQGTSPTLDVRGSMTLLAGTSWSAIPVTFSATTTGKTVTTNGASINNVFTFDGVGGEWTLGSAINLVNANLTVTNGTFNSGNYSITAGGLSSNNANTRTINLGSSTVTINGGFGIFFNTQTGLTFNAGTSQINFTGAGVSPQIQTGVTFYNVAFTSTTSGTKAIIGTNTFNNLAVTAPSAAGLATVTFNAQQTINGTLSTTGTAGNRRVFFASATYGISVDLVVNSAPSLTDADFRGLYVRGTSAPISGTCIGNRGECRGITFDTPKTVYWNLAGAQNWSANGWSDTSTGTPNTNFFPLPQDTATFTNAGSVTGTITLDTAIAYVPNVDMSGRTSAMTLGTSNATTVYGNWQNGSGTAFTGISTLTFAGGTTQTITSAGKTFTGGITVDTYGGTVQLADALNIGTNTLTVTNGTFDTKGYAVTADVLSSSNSNVRTITLGSSTLNLASPGINFTTNTNLTFNANTSTINMVYSASGSNITNFGSQTFYNVSITNNSASTFSRTINGTNTFNNLTLAGGSASANIQQYRFGGNQTINGTLTCAGASAVRRIFLSSNTIGTQRTLTVNSISATDCDFRDINLAGTASGASPTRAGDCGGNSGITFPAAKTVYWNLAGAQNWSATAWAPGSGGTPDINNFPLSQDTAVFDNTGSVTGTITINTDWNIGTFDASNRTSAMTLTTSTNAPVVYGDWKFGTGVTSSSTTGIITFSKNGTQTITSNGVQFGCLVTINHPSGTVQLADALSLNSARTLTLTTGTFDAVSYNVTTGLFTSSSGTTTKMGTGTWTLSGTGTVWTGAGTNIASTSTIVLSDTSTTARTFDGGGLYYNKLTIGGTTGTSTLTISGANTFGEIASTKTVAHTITLPSSTTTTVGKWSVTGTSGNVVTLAPSTAATTYTLSIAGPANTGINYLSVSYCAVSTTSPGEFYVGANSTNTAGNTGAIIFTATPAARTLYWVGGTGNWSSTTKWSTTDGSGSGAAIPTSLDAVNFTNLSNATAYTATIDAGVTIARCASFTMAGPGTGNVTFAGTVPIAFHGNVSFAATGITRTYTGGMSWAGNSSYTFTTNGLALNLINTIIGIGSTWTLGSAFTTNTQFIVTYGSFGTSVSNYALTAGSFNSTNNNVRSVSFNGSSLSFDSSGVAVNFGTSTNLTFSAGTSTINSTGIGGFSGGNLTFNNVSFTNAAPTSITITGANTFNTLSFAGRTTVGITPVTFDSNQTITTLTLNAGTASAYRTFLASNTLGTQRTLTVTTLTAGAADYDFRDIAITGGAAPIAPTRAGDGKGNSGITFPAAKTVYYRQTGSANWGTTGTGSWSATSGGGFDATQFPLAQDTAVFPAATYPASGSTTTVNANYNIGTIDMNLRTANTMTLATGSTTPQIYGNWINGTGTTLTGTGRMTFAGRSSQTIRSEGKTFTQTFTIESPSGTVTLQDALAASQNVSAVIRVNAGTFDAAGYNVTLSGASSTVDLISSTLTRTAAVGSGTWSIAGSGNAWNATIPTNLTVTGTGTISLTSGSVKTFAGGGISYSGITLDQGGAGTLTINGNNTFKDITNTYSATGATTISLTTTTQTVTNFTGTGVSGKVLILNGSSAASSATLVITGSVGVGTDYINVNNVRGYPLADSWKIGVNSTNAGSLGFIFVAASGNIYNSSVSETSTAADAIAGGFLFLASVQELLTIIDQTFTAASFSTTASETAVASETVSALGILVPAISETATASDAQSAIASFRGSASESATASETTTVAASTFGATSAETATAQDSVNAPGSTYNPSTSETAQALDTPSAAATFPVATSEAATVADQNAAAFTAATNISESATAADITAALVAFAALTAENASASDQTLVVPSTFNAVAAAAAQAFDSVNAPGSIYNAAVVNTAVALDSIIGAFLWNLIDDSQNPNWVGIASSQNPNWTGIDDNQSPNWQNISNS
jgi:hypothetical protein